MTGREKKFHSSSVLKKTSVFLCLVILAISICAFVFPFCKAISPLFKSGYGAVDFESLLPKISYTFRQAILSLLLSLLIGVPSGFFLARRNFPFRNFFSSFAAVPLAVPPLIMALGYVSVFGFSGLINSFLMNLFSLSQPPFKFIYSLWGVVIVQGFYNFPLIMTTVADSWNSIDASQKEAARLLGASEIKIFFTITLHQLLSAISSACIPVFLYCFFSFMIVMMFGPLGKTTMEVAIYTSARNVLALKQTAVLALIETLCAYTILIFYNALENKTSPVKHSVALKARRKNLTVKEFIAALPLFFLVLIFFVFPLASIFIQSFTDKVSGKIIFSFKTWKYILTAKTFLKSFLNTIASASLTGLLSTICGFTFSCILWKNARNKKLFFALKSISLLPMSISSVVTGLGFIYLVKKGNFFTLVLAQTALTWPFAFRQIFSQFKKIPAEVYESGILLSKNYSDFIFNILIPYTKNGILSSIGFCFALSAADASLPLVLSMRNFETLSLFVYRLAGSFHFRESSAAGIILTALCIFVFRLSVKLKEK